MTTKELSELYFNLNELKNKTITQYNSVNKFAKFKHFVPSFDGSTFKLYNASCVITFDIIIFGNGVKILGYEVEI